MYQPPGARVAASLIHGMPNFTHYFGDGARFPLKRKKKKKFPGSVCLYL